MQRHAEDVRPCMKDVFRSFFGVQRQSIVILMSFYPSFNTIISAQKCTNLAMYHFCTNRNRKKRRRISPSPLGNAVFQAFFLAEVSLQQALKGLAMPGLVTGHLINRFAALAIAGERITAEKTLLFRHFKFVF